MRKPEYMQFFFLGEKNMQLSCWLCVFAGLVKSSGVQNS